MLLRPPIVSIESLYLNILGFKQSGKCPDCGSKIIGSRSINWCSNDVCKWTNLPTGEEFINGLKEIQFKNENEEVFL